MSYYQYKPSGFSFMPPVIKNLLIINGLFFLATLVFQQATRINLIEILGLPYVASSTFKIYQVVTHFFMHADLGHIFSNMFALWMFGTALEHKWGPKRFLFFYFFTAFGAAFLHQLVTTFEVLNARHALEIFQQNPTVTNLIQALEKSGDKSGWTTTISAKLQSLYTGNEILSSSEVTEATKWVQQSIQNFMATPMVGASGAVFGLLIAFALYHPNTELFILFLPFPIKAKYFVGFYAAMEVYLSIQNNPNDSVAHFAHLGGALFGYILVKYWNKTNRKSLY